MHRTQISLEERQYDFLAQESSRQGISLSELIRRLISDYMRQHPTEPDPLDRLAGIAEGDGEAVGRLHDDYLFGRSRS
jgi:hypothetical protein